MTVNAHISHMVLHYERAGSPAWLKPIVMEATVRGGADRGAVVAAFAATPEDETKLDELLAGPPIWHTTKKAA